MVVFPLCLMLVSFGVSLLVRINRPRFVESGGDV